MNNINIVCSPSNCFYPIKRVFLAVIEKTVQIWNTAYQCTKNFFNYIFRTSQKQTEIPIHISFRNLRYDDEDSLKAVILNELNKPAYALPKIILIQAKSETGAIRILYDRSFGVRPPTPKDYAETLGSFLQTNPFHVTIAAICVIQSSIFVQESLRAKAQNVFVVRENNLNPKHGFTSCEDGSNVSEIVNAIAAAWQTKATRINS